MMQQKVRNVHVAQRVTLQCVTPFDYELLLLEQEYFEEAILRQGALVMRKQQLPVWLRQQSMPIHLTPLQIVPDVSCALMSLNTELEIEITPGMEEVAKLHGPLQKNPCHALETARMPSENQSQPPKSPSQKSDRFSSSTHSREGSARSSQKMKRKSCELRLQRSTKEVDKMLKATTKSLLFDTWFAEGLCISTPISTVLLLDASAAANLECRVGDFVIVSKKRISSAAMPSNGAVLRVLFHPAVAKGHCMMSEEVASEIGASYCSRIFVMKALPQRTLASELQSIALQPIKPQVSPASVKDPAKQTPVDENAKNGVETGTAYLKKVLAEVMDIGAFSNPYAGITEPAHTWSIKQTAQKAAEYCSKIVPFSVEGLMERLPAFKSASNTEDEETQRLEIFLKALVMGWVEAQLEGSKAMHDWFCHQVETDKSLNNNDILPKIFKQFCFSPKCFLHFCIEGAGTKNTKMMLRLQLAENELCYEGVLVAKLDLWFAMRQNHCAISIVPMRSLPIEPPERLLSTFRDHQMPPWLETLSQECSQFLKPTLGFRGQNESFKGTTACVMLSGGRESGKTSFVSAVCQRLMEDASTLTHVAYIPCRSMWSMMKQSFKGFTKQKLLIYQHVEDALSASPSILVFDDLDSWCTATEDGISNFTINSTRKRAAMMVRDIIDHVRATGAPVAFMATCTSLKDVDESLCEAGFFDCHLQMPDLTTPIRAEMMQYLFHQNKVGLHPKALQRMSQWDAGFEYADLERLVSRTLHLRIHRAHRNDMLITEKDIKLALETFKPAAQWKTSSEEEHALQSGGLEEVGGMDKVKAILRDCVELPIKYPDLMKRCPLRLMANVLLYGPPGSGKTFVVNALKASLGVRLVSVKGPELLDKYIGQSEAAVRSTFKAAAEAAPCILFFDEFEALGRHRGNHKSHSSDRVVNQLLTEMDGVEGLTGVCVIAATSRPDLIDKALLRPGRLDRHIFCDFPDLHDRQKILEVVSKKQELHQSIDLSQLARDTEGYSGADLASIISEAHLHAVSQYVRTHPDPTNPPPSIAISAADIAYAMEHSHPSCTDQDRQFLERIYSSFSGGTVCKSRFFPENKERQLTFA